MKEAELSQSLRNLLNDEIKAETGGLEAVFRASDAGQTYFDPQPQEVLKDVHIEAFLTVTLVEGNPRNEVSCAYDADSGGITNALLRALRWQSPPRVPPLPGDPEYRGLPCVHGASPRGTECGMSTDARATTADAEATMVRIQADLKEIQAQLHQLHAQAPLQGHVASQIRRARRRWYEVEQEIAAALMLSRQALAGLNLHRSD